MKYKVVPKGEGHSPVKVEEAPGKHARNTFWVERFISGRTAHWLLVAHNASMHWLCNIGTNSDSFAHSVFFQQLSPSGKPILGKTVTVNPLCKQSKKKKSKKNSKKKKCSKKRKCSKKKKYAKKKTKSKKKKKKKSKGRKRS